MFKKYIPSFLKSTLEDSRPLQLNFSQVKNTNIASTASFKYEPGNFPLKSTQQLNVDWSKFENHTFFSSAETKVNIAFDQIINSYPFDGSKVEVERFFENLTGFEKWVFDQFPKFRGYLAFSGTLINETPSNGFDEELGTWIKTKDYAGSLFPEISKNNTGESIISPKGTSISFEAQVFPSNVLGGKQVIFQKRRDDTSNIGIYIDSGYSSNESELMFAVVSGSVSLNVKAPISKNKFSHICAVWDREKSLGKLDLFVNEALVNSSKHSYSMHDLDLRDADITIGSGSSTKVDGSIYEPVQTFSGSLDELRVFHSIRSIQQQKSYAKKSVFASPDLKLYYKFNEPPPPLTQYENDQINSIVLDSSGNSLHGLIQNFLGPLRLNAEESDENPMIYENKLFSPILFPAYLGVTSLNEDLISSASAYDQENPNIITRLIPQHYFEEASIVENIEAPLAADTKEFYGGSGLPRQGKMTSAQVIMSFLYIWSKFFDEIKLYVDAFSTIKHVDYNKFDSAPDNFLSDLVSSWGVYLPSFFNNSTIEQYVDGENIDSNISTSTLSLREVQNEIMRRILINMPEVIRSKGTQHAIKSFLRSIGVDPNNSLRIREFGGPTTKAISFAREKRIDSGVMLQFSSGSLVLSPFLSGSRTEPGFPNISGDMVNTELFPPYGISNNPNDGLFTSGSWSIEGIFKYRQQPSSEVQSLVRLCNFDISEQHPWSFVGTLEPNLVANLLLVFDRLADRNYLKLYLRTGDSASSPLLGLQLDLPKSSFYDNERWNVVFGCNRNDSVDSINSSSYFLMAASQNDGDIAWISSTSSWFHENPTGEINVLREKNSTNMQNFISMGENQAFSIVSRHLNDTANVPSDARTTLFNGQSSNVRFWSKGLTLSEFTEHTRNYKSLGVQDPLVNYNFVSTREGSFEKVRIDSMMKQESRTASSNGQLTVLDFSQNDLHLSGTGLPSSTKSFVGEIFDYSHLSPYFDEAATDEKIRVRGYEDFGLVQENPWSQLGPVHEITKSERPTDDTRMSIEFSLIDALNRDIVTMFSTFDAIENAIGSPELLYSPDYPDLEKLRDVYFNRIKDKLNFQSFFEFFRWFDKSFGRFIEQLVPRKTQFKGTNFTIESHMLERSKLEYLGSEMYLGQEDRSRIRDVLLLQQLSGILKRY
jgi:hypothetical protein